MNFAMRGGVDVRRPAQQHCPQLESSSVRSFASIGLVYLETDLIEIFTHRAPFLIEPTRQHFPENTSDMPHTPPPVDGK